MLRLNFALLDSVLQVLYTMLNKIEAAYEALAKLDTLFEKSEGTLMDVVREKRDKLLWAMDYSQERFANLADILDRYLQDLRRVINPIDVEAYVVIDIDSRRTALKNIEDTVNNIYNTIIHKESNSFPQIDIDEETAVRNETQIQHNAETVDTMRETCNAVHAALAAKLQELKDIFTSYEEVERIDNDYETELWALYNEYISIPQER